jgi:hypothetical protein
MPLYHSTDPELLIILIIGTIDEERLQLLLRHSARKVEGMIIISSKVDDFNWDGRQLDAGEK